MSTSAARGRRVVLFEPNIHHGSPGPGAIAVPVSGNGVVVTTTCENTRTVVVERVAG